MITPTTSAVVVKMACPDAYTATPAKLDFRETEISVEGCVNAMSTGSAWSMRRSVVLR